MKQPLRRPASGTKRNPPAAEAGRSFPLTKLGISRRLPRRGGKKGGGKNAPRVPQPRAPQGAGAPRASPPSARAPHPLPLGTTSPCSGVAGGAAVMGVTYPISPHCLCLLQSFSSRSPHRLSFQAPSLAMYSTTTKVEAQPTTALATPEAPRQPGGRAPPAVRRREGQEKGEGRGQGWSLSRRSRSRSRRGCLLPLGGRLRVKQGRAGGDPSGDRVQPPRRPSQKPAVPGRRTLCLPSQQGLACNPLASGTFLPPVPHPCVPGPALPHIGATVTQGWSGAELHLLLLTREMELMA